MKPYDRRTRTYRPPHQHATPRRMTPEQRHQLAELLEQLATDVRAGIATTAGVSVQPAQRIDRTDPRSPTEPGAIVYLGITVDSPSLERARGIEQLQRGERENSEDQT
ncbi:hypothetical protein [Amycolatopsis pigmentata]|uniref:Uncharacterized protein n=1 Tax=Amycolatopsis pigmentata TaxID=450801 RepID=A0ABW5G2V0_9PSEU